MSEATRLLGIAEAGAKKQAKASKSLKQTGRYPPGTEYELMTACATILLGLTNALRFALCCKFSLWTAIDMCGDSESYMGYLQCLYVCCLQLPHIETVRSLPPHIGTR